MSEVEEFDCQVDEREKRVLLKMASGNVDGVVVQINGRQRALYLNDLSKRAKYVGGEFVGLCDFIDLHAFLLNMSLLKVVDGKRGPFTAKEIASIPPKVQEKLYAISQDINGLQDVAEAQEEAKKD